MDGIAPPVTSLARVSPLQAQGVLPTAGQERRLYRLLVPALARLACSSLGNSVQLKGKEKGEGFTYCEFIPGGENKQTRLKEDDGL